MMLNHQHRSRKVFHDNISLLAASLQVGEQTREMLCPECNGGSTKEKSFSIKKELDRIMYNCFRASCSVRGIIGNPGSLLDPPTKMEVSESTARPYMGRMQDLPNAAHRFLERKFGLYFDDTEDAQVKYNPEENRYVFPVFSYSYAIRGHTLRTFEDTPRFPKWDHYSLKGDVNWMGWYLRPWCADSRPVVVVEDPISALKVSRHFPTAYLCGTNLNFHKLLEICRHAKENKIVIALDKDATAKGIELLREYRFFLSAKASCVALGVDLKYSSDKEIREIIGKVE